MKLFTSLLVERSGAGDEPERIGAEGSLATLSSAVLSLAT